LLTSGERSVFTFSGTIKRVKRRAAAATGGSASQTGTAASPF
jgi:hypothetical protein